MKGIFALHHAFLPTTIAQLLIDSERNFTVDGGMSCVPKTNIKRSASDFLDWNYGDSALNQLAASSQASCHMAHLARVVVPDHSHHDRAYLLRRLRPCALSRPARRKLPRERCRSQRSRMSAAMCGCSNSESSPGCRFAHPGCWL